MSKVLEDLQRRQERGEISREYAEGLTQFYKVALDRHGDDEAAKREIAAWLAKVRERARTKPPPVPTAVKTLQAIVGCAVGAGIGLAATHILIYFFRSLFEFTGATRVRVPIAGILVVFAAPLIGAVLGALVGWGLDARAASSRLRRYLDTASVLDRAWIAWGGVWTGIILIAFTAFDPFNRYSFYWWRANDVVWFLVIWVGPIVGGWIVSRLVRWVASGSQG